MLTLPASRHHQFPNGETATVFDDDARFWVKYVVAGFPQVRLDTNGDPVFMLVQYLFSDATRAEHPEVGTGGGYMVFDAELRISSDNMAALILELQSDVDDEWERLRSQPNSRLRTLRLGATFNDSIGGHWQQPGHEGTPMANPTSSTNTTLTMPSHDAVDVPVDKPNVVLGEPLWKSGTVTMNAPASAGLVENTIGQRPASLIGNNVAAFSLDVTADGADFMRQTLVEADGTGASNLAPIQVTYSLTMLAKLPPATMFVKFDTASIYHAVQELFHEHDNTCSDDYFTSESLMTTAIEAGLITIKIDMGGITDDDMEQMLVQQAMNTVQSLLAERLADQEQAPLEEWADEDLVESSREVYRLKRETEVDMISFEQTMEINSTIEYTIAPQGTLQTFFRGRTDMAAFVREIRLGEDPFFKTLGLSARAFGQFVEDGIAFVELHVEYDHGGVLKTETFTFTSDSMEPQVWDPSLVDGEREYRYRYRVAFLGREPEDWSDWENSTARDLNVAVETPGMLKLTVTGVGLDFENVLDAVLVHMRYDDRRNDVSQISQSILLAADRASGEWNRHLFAPWAQPVEYRVEYLLKNGLTRETGWESTDGPTQNILVSRPDVDVLDISLIPAGIWTDVVQAAVSVRYEDGELHADQQFNLRKPDEFRQWKVLLDDPSRREFEYRLLATFNNGDTQETDWLVREGDQAVPIMVEGPPRLEVKISGQVLDYISTPVAQIDMIYTAADGTRENDSFVVQASTDVHLWSIPIADDTARQYQYQLTYFPAEGAPLEQDVVTTEDELIMVPRVSVPKVGAEFNPALQDFDLISAMVVSIDYDDPQRGVHESNTLIFTGNESQSWFLIVPEDAVRDYRMVVTWHFSDGTDVSTDEVTSRSKKILIPRPVHSSAAGRV